jgi:deoxyribonuclease-1
VRKLEQPLLFMAFGLIAGCDRGDLEALREVAETARSTATSATSPLTTSPAPPPRRVEAPPRPKKFREAKERLRDLYRAQPSTTLYSNCPLNRLDVDWARCCMREADARRPAVEWEHVVPAATFGGSLPEWREGHPRCAKKGRPFRGRKCARRASKRFEAMEGDMHNLFPELGDVNGARGDTPIGAFEGPSTRHQELASCGLRFGRSVVEPRDAVHGDVARAYLYMNAAYPDAVPLDEASRATFERWHVADPPDALERLRNRVILEEQGNGNPWIE